MWTVSAQRVGGNVSDVDKFFILAETFQTIRAVFDVFILNLIDDGENFSRQRFVTSGVVCWSAIRI